MDLMVGQEVFFTIISYITNTPHRLTGRVLKVNPNGTVTCRSASGLIVETVKAEDVEPVSR